MAKQVAKTENKDRAEAAKAESTELIVPNSKAMSVDVGPQVLGLIANSVQDEAKAEALRMTASNKKNLAQSVLTSAIVKMTEADKRLAEHLADVVSDNKGNKARINDALRIGLGLLEIKGTAKVMTADARKYFGSGKEKKGTDAHKKAESMRTAFSRLLGNAGKAALGLLDLKAVVSVDTNAGTLRISGPKVVEAFGEDNVLLDERKAEGELKVSPSIAEVRRIAERERGIEHHAPTRTTAGATAVEGDAQQSVRGLCASLIAGINRLEGTVDEDTAKSLKSVQSAIANLISPIVDAKGRKKAA